VGSVIRVRAERASCPRAAYSQNLDTVVDLLMQVDEDTDDPYKFLILGVSDMNGHQVAAIKDQHKVPLVVFATDAQQDDPNLDEGAPPSPDPPLGHVRWSYSFIILGHARCVFVCPCPAQCCVLST